jgi:hypothetical protein
MVTFTPDKIGYQEQKGAAEGDLSLPGQGLSDAHDMDILWTLLDWELLHVDPHQSVARDGELHQN